jgi:hypothetical protein
LVALAYQGETGTARAAADAAGGKIRRLPSGRFQVSYTGRDHHRHVAPATFSSRLAAEGWLADERRLYEDAANWTPPAVREAAAVARREAETLTLADYAQTWIEHRDLKPRTRIAYIRPRWPTTSPRRWETRRSASCPPRRCGPSCQG